MAEITLSKIRRILLLGGEPLLHPQIVDFFKIIKEYFPKSIIAIRTNGILLNKMKNNFWEELYKNHITLEISPYPIETNWEPVIKKVKENKIIAGIVLDGRLRNIEEIKNKKVSYFGIPKINENGSEPIINNCWGKKLCNTLSHGKIYPCSIATNIRHFNTYFDKNIPITDEDYIDIYKTESILDILNFLNKPYQICKYCKDFTICEYVPWELSKNPDIKEWIKK